MSFFRRSGNAGMRTARRRNERKPRTTSRTVTSRNQSGVSALGCFLSSYHATFSDVHSGARNAEAIMVKNGP